MLQEALHMDALLEVLPNLKPSGGRVQQVGDDLLVDLQEAASACKSDLLPFFLMHTQPHSQCHSIYVASCSQDMHAGSCICRTTGAVLLSFANTCKKLATHPCCVSQHELDLLEGASGYKLPLPWSQILVCTVTTDHASD